MTITLPNPVIRDADATTTKLYRHGPQGGYLAKNCFHQAALDNMPGTYPPEQKNEYSAFAKSLMSSGNTFEDHIGSLIGSGAPAGSVAVLLEDKDEHGERTVAGKAKKEEQTWAAYRDPKVRLIFNARLAKRFEELVSEYFGTATVDLDRVSEPDAIVLGPVMTNGLRAMAFIDVKWHKTTSGPSAAKEFWVSPLEQPFWSHRAVREFEGSLKSDDWMQLAHYYRHGESLGLVDDETSLWGAVIGKEEVLVWAELDAPRFMRADPNTGRRRKQSALEMYDRDFAFALRVVDNALTRDAIPSTPALTFPEWKADCKECPWKDVCLDEMKAHGDGGHITLLPGITPAKAKPLYDVGVTSIGDLARLSPDLDVAGFGDVADAVYQARVTRAQKVFRAPGVEQVDLPRAAIEIDFDYEASAEHVYQRGVLATGRSRKANGDIRTRVERNTFDDFSATDDGELTVFTKFWAYITSMLALAKTRKHSIRFYYYTHYERTQDTRLARKYAGRKGVPSVAEVEEFYDSPLAVDMYAVLSKQLVWPTRSHSIKELAKWVRFTWRDESPGGDMSMLWYALACNAPDQATREENIIRGREYNEDDTGAQFALREFVSGLAASRKPSDKLAAVESLKAPFKARTR